MKLRCFIFLIIVSFKSYGQETSRRTDFDKIQDLRAQSNKSSNKFQEKLNFAKQALELSTKIGVDSSIISDYKNISLLYLYDGRYENYRKYAHKGLSLGKKIKDTLAMASAHFNVGQSHYIEFRNDSAYYHFSKSFELYDYLQDQNRKAKILLNLADIQDTEQDYIGSETNAIKALKLYEILPKTEVNLDRTWMLNNLLGIVSMKLGFNEKSLEYHTEAQNVAEDMRQEGFYNKVFSINNIAFVYRKQKDYDKSLELYQSLVDIREDYDDYDPTFYPLVLENMAYTKLIAGHTDYEAMERNFKEAYRISDSLDDPITKIAVSIDLSKYYFQRHQPDSSLKYANITYDLAKETSSNEILLDAIKVLSKLKSGEEGKAYLEEHIALSDSLLNVERNVRNKFARIEFETDKIEEENERMTVQRKWLLIVSVVLLLTLFLLYIIITQRNKNRELQFEKDQQKVNEEIYNLMLTQQDKVDEARAYEKKRISQEMHDGVLGRLFGTRLSLDSLNFSEGKDAMMSRANYISELKTIEEDIRKISHDLNTDFVSGSNFMAIVSELINKQTKAYQLKYHFDYADDLSWEEVSNKTKINLYRIIQEGLQNIYKHAEANEVEIGFKEKNGHICLTISDDGKGFDVHKSKKGIGLKNINNRVSELDGQVTFDSQKKKGTTVRILIPYKN